jgi:hypothetical protein
MDDLLGALERLEARLEGLERRVSALEGRSQALPISPAQAAELSEEATHAVEKPALPTVESAFSVVGKAMLGIAGAYVLRAIAESGSFPRLAVVVLALAYAAMWLVWAARAAAEATLARAAYATTAALILAPMLAELTLRFQVLPASITAGLLSAFVVAASALAWKRNLVSLVWVANSAAVLTTLALLIVSHDLVPYTTSLLVIAAVAELAARNRWESLRFLVAPAVDIAVLILVYIHSLPESSRPDYAAVSTSTLLALTTLLFLIYGASIASRTVFLRCRITLFEVVQAVIVFLLAAISWLWFAPVNGRAALGVCCWFLSAACYGAAFARFDRIQDQRNYHTYSTWSVALVLAGSFLVLPPILLVLVLSGGSIVATLIGVRVARLTLEFHGLVYLTAAAFASSLLVYAARALAGTFPTAPGWIVWIVAVSAVGCYVIGGRFPSDLWNQRLLRLLAAVLAVSAVATFLVSGLVWLAAIGMTPGASHVAVIRTLITCALALALALSGSRWRRIELVWTAYGTLAFVTAKLLFEDLPHGHSASIAISIFLYAVALIIVPRLARAGR